MRVLHFTQIIFLCSKLTFFLIFQNNAFIAVPEGLNFDLIIAPASQHQFEKPIIIKHLTRYILNEHFQVQKSCGRTDLVIATLKYKRQWSELQESQNNHGNGLMYIYQNIGKEANWIEP